MLVIRKYCSAKHKVVFFLIPVQTILHIYNAYAAIYFVNKEEFIVMRGNNVNTIITIKKDIISPYIKQLYN